MASSRFNLTVLRAGSLPAAQPLISSLIPFPPPVGKLQVDQSPGLVVFRLNGVPAWTIDVKRFADSPKLVIKPTPQGGMRIELKGARYPGTQLSADCVCVLGKSGAFGTPMDLKLSLGGFHGQAMAERWLAGSQHMESAVTVEDVVCELGDASRLAIVGSAEARFFPSWLTTMQAASALATVSGLGADLTSTTFTLKLLLPTEPSLSAHPKSRRSRMGLLAGGEVWLLKPFVLGLPIGTLEAADGLFTRLEVEAGEGPSGDVERVLAAQSTRDDGLQLRLAGGITDLDGQQGTLTLAFPHYAVVFDPSGDATVLGARFNELPRWLAAEGFALRVGDPTGPPTFEVDTTGGAVTAVQCAPSLLTVAAPLAGNEVATKPLPLSAPTLLPIVATAGATPGWGLIASSAVTGGRRLSLPYFSVALLRKEDLLSLEFLFFNLAIEGGGGSPPQLVQKDSTAAAYVVVRFNAPQNIAEQAFLETYGDSKNSATGETPTAAPVERLAAGPSRLAFQLPGGTTALTYTLDALLDWLKLDASVAPVALPDTSGGAAVLPPPALGPIAASPVVLAFGGLDIGGIAIGPVVSSHPVIREPLPTETAIEAPWQLFLSPDQTGAWKHSTDSVTLSGRTELWHTRLAVRAEQADGSVTADETLPRKIRAIWTAGFVPHPMPGHTPNPVAPDFRKSLDRNDRYQIVRQSADFTIPNHAPKPIDAEKLFLSSLGAWMDVRGSWEPVTIVDERLSLSLEEWRHRAVMARDNYVRVVTAGFLLPFGHRASLVKVTERKFQSIGGGPTTAYLRQRFFIIVRRPEQTYDFLSAAQQRGIPYQKLTITTLVTPNLDAPETDPASGGFYSFMPKVGGAPFLFHLMGQDHEQQETQTSEFSAPLYFVEFSNDGIYQDAVNHYQASGLRTRNLDGQKVAFARSQKAGDTTFHTADMTFAAVKGASGQLPPIFPSMEGAHVSVPAVQQVTGQPGPMSIRFYQKYLDGDFGAGGVFLENAAGALSVRFRADQSGGVATPNLQVTGLSRQFGPISGTVDKIAGGTFDPKDYLSDVGAQLFGVIPLMDLVKGIFSETTVPSLVTKRLPDRTETTLHWQPTVDDYSAGFIKLVFTGDKAQSLTLDVKIVTLLAGGAPQASVDGHLTGFNLELAEVIALRFKSFAFTAPAGKKIDVNVALADSDPIEFLGDLSFLNELRKLIPSDGFEDPPFLDVRPDGLTAGYSLAIPTIGLGVFSIENIKLSAALTLPFISGPLRFRFAFSEREDPFLITVSLLGGGGFFGLAVGPDGVELLEASMEVGANVSLDVVVASGNVHIMAGVYLKLDFASNSSQLTGYLRAGGSLDVLGLISASVEFYLGFTYYFGPPCRIAGEATVTIEVHVLFFSASVHASLRREFADPVISVRDLIAAADWTTYCEAFAA